MMKKLVCSLILGSLVTPFTAQAGEGIEQGTLRKMLELTWAEGRDWDGDPVPPVPSFTFERSQHNCVGNLGIQTCTERYTVKSQSEWFNGRIYQVTTFSRDIGQLEVVKVEKLRH